MTSATCLAVRPAPDRRRVDRDPGLCSHDGALVARAPLATSSLDDVRSSSMPLGRPALMAAVAPGDGHTITFSPPVDRSSWVRAPSCDSSIAYFGGMFAHAPTLLKSPEAYLPASADGRRRLVPRVRPTPRSLDDAALSLDVRAHRAERHLIPAARARGARTGCGRRRRRTRARGDFAPWWR
jgi:hypothetical protein